MNFNKLTVVPKIPENLKMLETIAYNVWWTWNSKAIAMFKGLNAELWKSTNHNPIKVLNNIDGNILAKASQNEEFLALYQKVVAEYEQYMSDKNTWLNQNHPKYENNTVAYLCAEYGIHESIPIYSGGLGVLAGDHLKSASDLGLPLVAVGLLYQKGYFNQQIQKNGNQKNVYYTNNVDELPVREVLEADGSQLLISVLIEDEEVYAKVWEINIGINKLYLLDTNIEQNSCSNMGITDTLYGGDQNQRIRQEILLGIGGVKLLRKLNIEPSAWHINEGHSAFFVFERIREYMTKMEIDFYEALEIAKSNTIFTTHTPVSAGNDMFGLDMIEQYFKTYFKEFKTNVQYLTGLGEHIAENGDKLFSMTVLALKTTTFANGVSELHGNVSRELWKNVWNNVPVNEIPIDYITNGIHSFSWVDKRIKGLISQNFEMDYRSNIDDEAIWNKIMKVPNKNLWDMHQLKKSQLLNLVKERVYEQRVREYSIEEANADIANFLDKDVLTLGFARRFATYKRANLIFKDIDRLKKILNNPKKPVQLVFAGKAHPADIPGQNIIKNIYEISRMEDFKGKIFFVENYDMNLARAMVQGVDVWLNNPRRPYEASGTSGEKAAANGVINFSVLDGWWCEGYNGDNGWAIGDYRKYNNNDEQDWDESKYIYDILENDIIPMYYTKNADGIPESWVEKMKNSMSSIGDYFSMHRQVKEYYEKFYIHCIQNKMIFDDKTIEMAKRIKNWKDRLYKNWDSIEIKDIKYGNSRINYGSELVIKADVNLQSLEEEDVVVQAYIGILDENDNIVEYKTVPMNKNEKIDERHSEYETNIRLDAVGRFAYTTRIIPNALYPVNTKEIGLIKWAE